MNVEIRPIKSIRTAKYNPRRISDQQLASLKASIERFGFVDPVIVNDRTGILVGGHQRIKAAKDLGLKDVPVVAVNLDEAEEKALNVALNKISGDWDLDLLRGVLEDVQAGGLDLSLTGFTEDEWSAMGGAPAGTAGLTDPDEVPELPEETKTITKPGDLWLLGDHRLLCGDSTKAEDVTRLMDGAKADLCFTSPPYGQQRDYTEEGKEKCRDWDKLMIGVFQNLPMNINGQVLVNLGLIHRDGEWVPYWNKWIEWMGQQGWRRFGWYVWDQGPGMPGDWNGRLAPSHEFIWHFNKESVKAEKARACKHAGQSHTGKGQRSADGSVKNRSHANAQIQSHAIHDSVFRCNRQGASHGADGHPAPYPIGLPVIALESWKGQVFDPFLGSGTTLIAAEQLGRKCYGLEISPQYCDVIVRRWEQFTGKKAVCDGG